MEKTPTHNNYSTNLLSCQHLLFVSQNVNNRLHLPKNVKNTEISKKTIQKGRFCNKKPDNVVFLSLSYGRLFGQNRYIFGSLSIKNKRKCVKKKVHLLTFLSFDVIIILSRVFFIFNIGTPKIGEKNEL